MLYHRILITGANGLLGQELVSALSQYPEYDVLATGRDASPRFTGGSCGYAPLDVTREDDVQQLFDDFTPSVVINCAAMTQVDACETEREACWDVNAEAVAFLAKQCRLGGARLIQVSTDFVFDGDDGPYREADRPNPVNFYGKSKLAAENAVREAGLEKWAVARTVLVYGTGNELSRSNIVLWVLDSLSNDEPIRVVTDQWRTPTYAADLAAGIERMVRFGKTGLYHLSGRDFVSVYEFAQQIAHVFNLDTSLIHPITSDELDQTAPRPPRTGFIILKAETEFGFRPRSIPEALRHLGTRLGWTVTTS